MSTDLASFEKDLAGLRDDYRRAAVLISPSQDTYRARADAIDLALALLHARSRGEFGQPLPDQKYTYPAESAR